MHSSRIRRSYRSGLAATAVALLCVSAAWASPDARPADKSTPTSEKCAPLPAEESVETSLGSPAPEPGDEAPVLSGLPGGARFRDGDSRPLDNPLGWLLGSGPRGGLRLSAERLSRAPERKAGSILESQKSAKPAKRMAKARGGAGGHIAKPHRMPSLEIL